MNWFLILYLYSVNPASLHGYDWTMEMKASYASEAECKAGAKEFRDKLILKDGEGAGFGCVREDKYREGLKRPR